MAMDIMWKKILDQSGIVAYIDQFGKYVYVNKGWEQATGIDASNAIGHHVSELLSGSDAMVAMRTGKRIKAEAFIRSSAGKDIATVMRYQPIFGEDRTLRGCLATSLFDDIEEAKIFTENLAQMFEEFDYYEERGNAAGTAEDSVDSIVGISRAMQELREKIYIAGASSAACLIEGEFGTGKELVAHAIHDTSSRRIFPFIKANCSAIDENRVETEFFGYEADDPEQRRRLGRSGKIERAHLGSLFLDEVSSLSPFIQPRLVNVLREREIERVGSEDSIPVNVRLISASDVSLEKLVYEGRFRADLFYYLNVITFYIPPLRERKEDIEPLARMFIQKYMSESLGYVRDISDDAVLYLMEYDWPGNVRELQNTIERSMALTWSERLEVTHLMKYGPDLKKKRNGSLNLRNSRLSGSGSRFLCVPEDLSGQPHEKTPVSEDSEKKQMWEPEQNVEYRMASGKKEEGMETVTDQDFSTIWSHQKEESEKRAIMKAMEITGHNKTKAARMLNISRTLLYKKLAKYEIL